MSYQPLARKYRPKTFDDLVGQDSIALALTNAIKLDRIPQAVLFVGVRGVGKTTSARLFAKALNCVHGPTPSPCAECESCHAIDEGWHEDVMEVDGASNTSVDDVRALKDSIGYTPQRSKYKVYIVDEVHMLSQSAFNALLKTLEEPPPHVVFVFATTELQKIPITITSRCQTFALKKFSQLAIVDRIKSILHNESIAFDENAVVSIAKYGRGSMRDALTALDQVIALGNGTVTAAAVGSVLGVAHFDSYLHLLEAILQRDISSVLKGIESIDRGGTTVVALTEELATICRQGFVIKGMGSNHPDLNLLNLDSASLEAISKIAASAPELELNLLFRSLVKCLSDLDGSHLDRYIFENYLLEWCLDPGFAQVDDLLGSTSSPTLAKSGADSSKHNVNRALTSPTPLPSANSSPMLPRKKDSPAPRTNMLEQATVRTKDSSVVQGIVGDKTTEGFPASWRELVDRWKQKKPLQARILEEVYLVNYSPKEISLAVPSDSLAAAKLLQPAIQIKVKENFREMFGFDGELKIREQVGASRQESLLETKNREQDELRQKEIEEAARHPITQRATEIFGAKIERVVVDDVY